MVLINAPESGKVHSLVHPNSYVIM